MVLQPSFQVRAEEDRQPRNPHEQLTQLAPLRLSNGRRHLAPELALPGRNQRQLAHLHPVLHRVDQAEERRLVAQAAQRQRQLAVLLMVELPLEDVAHPQPRDARNVQPEPGVVDPGILRRQKVAHRLQFSPGIGRLHPLQQVVPDGIAHPPQILKEAYPPQSEPFPVRRQQQVGSPVLTLLGDLPEPLVSCRQPHGRPQKRAAVDVESPAILLVGVIRLFVVLKAVDPTVVVHIDAVEELRPVAVETEERLIVVRDPVGACRTVVLVEVGDEVAVLVPPRKNLPVAAGRAAAHPVRQAVLIVVVVDEFVALKLVAVVDNAVPVDHGEPGAVVRADAERLDKGEVRARYPGEIQKPGVRFVADGVVLFQIRVGILPVLVVDIHLQVAAESLQVGQFHGETGDLVGRGQTVVEGQHPLVGRILDVARCSTHRQKDLATAEVGLPVRSDLDQVVIGHHQFELHPPDLDRVRSGVAAALEVVAQPDHLVAIGGQKAAPLKAPLDQRPEADLAPPRLLPLQIVDDDVVGKERASPLSVLGRIILDEDLDKRYMSQALYPGEIPL